MIFTISILIKDKRHPTGPFTIGEPQDQEIGDFMQFRNVVPKILKLQNCERIRRVIFYHLVCTLNVLSAPTQFWSFEICRTRRILWHKVWKKKWSVGRVFFPVPVRCFHKFFGDIFSKQTVYLFTAETHSLHDSSSSSSSSSSSYSSSSSSNSSSSSSSSSSGSSSRSKETFFQTLSTFLQTSNKMLPKRRENPKPFLTVQIWSVAR